MPKAKSKMNPVTGWSEPALLSRSWAAYPTPPHALQPRAHCCQVAVGSAPPAPLPSRDSAGVCRAGPAPHPPSSHDGVLGSTATANTRRTSAPNCLVCFSVTTLASVSLTDPKLYYSAPEINLFHRIIE